MQSETQLLVPMTVALTVCSRASKTVVSKNVLRILYHQINYYQMGKDYGDFDSKSVLFARQYQTLFKRFTFVVYDSTVVFPAAFKGLRPAELELELVTIKERGTDSDSVTITVARIKQRMVNI